MKALSVAVPIVALAVAVPAMGQDAEGILSFQAGAERAAGRLELGITEQLRRERVDRAADPGIADLGELAATFTRRDRVTVAGLLDPGDAVTFGANARRDLGEAHGGVAIDPSVAYHAPLARGVIASLSLGAEYSDERFEASHYGVDAVDSVVRGVPAFQPEGGGFSKAGANLALGFDLDGNRANGGPAVAVIGGYSRLTGDAKDSPMAYLRGSTQEFLGAVAFGFEF